MKDKKIIILISIIFITVLLLSLTLFLLINDKKGETIKKDDSLQVYGVVVEKGNNYLLVNSVDDKKYYVLNSEIIDLGTFVSISYASKKDVEKGNGFLEILLNEKETKIVDDFTNQDSTYLDEDEKVTTTTTSKTTTSTATSTISTITTTYRYTNKVSDDEIVSYASNYYSDVKSNKINLDGAKEKFILLVDFIFYDGEIKGKKFKELTSSAKAKVIYYTLLIDAGIDSKWPNYKDNINTKYNDIKSKLIAKYMDLTTSICESSKDNCAQAKSDFKLLKESVSLTWNTLKNAFLYAFDKGKNSLAEWYQIFSGRA